MLECLSLGIICSSDLKRSHRATLLENYSLHETDNVHKQEYSSTFSRQMEAIVYAD